MAIQVDVVPSNLDFGGIEPGGSGPDISVDPSLGPPRISFKGGVAIKAVPGAATVRASIAGDALFSVRDLIAMDWTWEEVDPGELPPGHRGPPPRVKVLEVSNQVAGDGALTVAAGQYLLVRVAYQAPQSGGRFAGELTIAAEGWVPIVVPLSAFLSGAAISYTGDAVHLTQGMAGAVPLSVQVMAGPEGGVDFAMSATQLHTGIALADAGHCEATAAPQTFPLPLRAAADAPLGANSIAVDWVFFNRRHGLFIPVIIDPISSAQKITGVSVACEPRNLVFQFKTKLSSRPTVTLWSRDPSHHPIQDMVPANLKARATEGGVPGKSHFIAFDNLPGNTTFWFRIDADIQEAGAPPGVMAVYVDWTATLGRTCTIPNLGLHVLQAGGNSSGVSDDNDVWFGVALYDADSRHLLPQPTYQKFRGVRHGDSLVAGFEDSGSGGARFANPANAIVVYVQGTCEDAAFGSSGLIGHGIVEDPMPAPPRSGVGDNGCFAAASGPALALHRLPGQYRSDAMTLTTGLTLLAFDVAVLVETSVTDPYGASFRTYPDP